MPSKFVAKSFVRSEIEAVRTEMWDGLEETRKAIVEQAKQLIAAASEVGPASGVDAAIDFGGTAHDIIAKMGTVINTHDEKLGLLTEAGLRRVVSEERGMVWAQQRKVGSITDMVNYIAHLSGEGKPWVDRALETIIDMFKDGDGLLRLVQLVQAVILNSTEESWEKMRKVVEAYPIATSTDINTDGLRRYQHSSPILSTGC